MKPHLILEGWDASGKSTIARVLVKEHGYAYRHEGPPPAQLEGDNLLAYYVNQLQGLTQPTVFDRFLIGETIYGPILRGRTNLSPRHVQLFYRACRARGAKQILCGPVNYNISLEAWKRRRESEMIKDVDTFLATIQAFLKIRYDQRVAVLSPPRGVFDYEQPRLPEGYAGSIEAKFLFVGERSNGPMDLPFMSDQGSSEFLNTALERAGFQEYEMAFVNAERQDGKFNPVGVGEGCQVIALGKVAEAWCKVSNLHGRRIPLPLVPEGGGINALEGYVTLLKRIHDEPSIQQRGSAILPASPAPAGGRSGETKGDADDRKVERAPTPNGPKKQHYNKSRKKSKP